MARHREEEDKALPWWKRPRLRPASRAMLSGRPDPEAPQARDSGGPKEKVSAHRLERESRRAWRDPVMEAAAETIRDDDDPFGALVDLAESLDIDVALLVTATIATELRRHEKALRLQGRPAFDPATAEWALQRLEELSQATAAAGKSDDPAEAAYQRLGGTAGEWPTINRAAAAAIAARIKEGRGRQTLTIAMEVLREEWDGPALPKGTDAKASKKRLRALAAVKAEHLDLLRWSETKEEATRVLRNAVGEGSENRI